MPSAIYKDDTGHILVEGHAGTNSTHKLTNSFRLGKIGSHVFVVKFIYNQTYTSISFREALGIFATETVTHSADGIIMINRDMWQ